MAKFFVLVSDDGAALKVGGGGGRLVTQSGAAESTLFLVTFYNFQKSRGEGAEIAQPLPLRGLC